jgi:Rod binding domain-containing protein
MMAAAQSLEAQFLSEMLKSAGIGQTPEEFGGGSGEDQFSSFLRDEQAKQMTQAGGIGLAQSLFDSMIANAHE